MNTTNEMIEAVAAAVATTRDQLAEDLAHLEHLYASKAEHVRACVEQLPKLHAPIGTVADSHRYICPQSIGRILNEMADLIGPMEAAKERLSMHDNPDNWRAEINHQHDPEPATGEFNHLMA